MVVGWLLDGCGVIMGCCGMVVGWLLDGCGMVVGLWDGCGVIMGWLWDGGLWLLDGCGMVVGWLWTWLWGTHLTLNPMGKYHIYNETLWEMNFCTMELYVN